ncbi:hypothetical protein CRUP_010058 [Coryphaenoides rupestris]|nr:hypothetical protein CRUP_010058 [Coryphaenoides rupestris]
MVLCLVTTGRCHDQYSRRSVTEHQLLHDRSRSIQSLKRLIWLSSAMEGLHTAQDRSALLSPPEARNLGPGPLTGGAEGPQPAEVNSRYKAAIDNLLRGIFKPYLMPPEREP